MIKPRLTLGSLFSGIGGFELAASFYDIEPKWASEVDKNCINVTKKRFPDMEHLGSILNIHGDTIPPVDIITGGSPCQDLSTAGAQAGIKYRCPSCETLVPIGESDGYCPKCGSELELTRSGLFMEQIRIIREMREKTNEHYPKVVVWENVPAALSSNGGDDFYCVLKEFCGLLGERLPTLRPERWTDAGEVLGKTGSLAWRILDAQYWGVPQRRRRIFLVVDFTGRRGDKILLESESLRRNTPKSQVSRQGLTGAIGESSTEANGISFAAGVDFKMGAACPQLTYNEGVSPTLRSTQPMGVLIDSHGQDSRFQENKSGVAQTLTANMDRDGANGPLLIENHSNDSRVTVSKDNVCQTLTRFMGTGGNNVPMVVEERPDEREVYAICSLSSNCMKSNNPNSGVYKSTVAKTLDTSGTNPACNQGGNIIVENRATCTETFHVDTVTEGTPPLKARDYKDPHIVCTHDRVRRLTPIECERLQGFPDNWTEGESDAARYRMLGNSVAVPCVSYIMGGIVDVLTEEESNNG